MAKGRIVRLNGVLYDTGTKNRSFLQVANDLKILGIKNFYFMLRLNDPTLINVDPYSDKLTEDQISRILFECRTNIWYYLREICRIPSQGGVPVHFIANRGNIAQIWCILHGLDSWLCLPRRTCCLPIMRVIGKTFLIAGSSRLRDNQQPEMVQRLSKP